MPNTPSAHFNMELYAAWSQSVREDHDERVQAILDRLSDREKAIVRETAVMAFVREAPVQGSAAARVPWSVHVRAWQVYAACGHGDQSAEVIARRGGFSFFEMVLLLAERNPFSFLNAELNEHQRGRLVVLRECDAEAER